MRIQTLLVSVVEIGNALLQGLDGDSIIISKLMSTSIVKHTLKLELQYFSGLGFCSYVSRSSWLAGLSLYIDLNQCPINLQLDGLSGLLCYSPFG